MKYDVSTTEQIKKDLDSSWSQQQRQIMEALTTVINCCSGRSTAMYLSSNRRGKYPRNYPYIFAQLLTTPTEAAIDQTE